MRKTLLFVLLFACKFCFAQILQPAIFLDENQLAMPNGTTLISDASANNGTCMFRPAQSGSGPLWYGPYNHIQAGNYLVQFRIKISSLSATNYLFQVDVSSLTLGSLAIIKVLPNMFKAANEWQLISIPVKIPDGINNIEVRGIDSQGLTDVYFDYVQILPTQLSGIISDELTILGNGNLGLGTTSPREKLSVNGNIRAKEIKVEATNWPDYVFDQDYKILGLDELDAYIKQHKHLPDMPSAKEVEAKGVELGEMNKLLLKKIEELTLHIIEMGREVKAQKREIETLKKK